MGFRNIKENLENVCLHLLFLIIFSSENVPLKKLILSNTYESIHIEESFESIIANKIQSHEVHSWLSVTYCVLERELE